MITAGSLFSGIGGIDLAMSLAGFDIRWQIEVDEFCRRVLAKHSREYWRNATQFTDVRRVTARTGKGWRGYKRLERVDVLFGGFPCQDISISGNKAGIREGTRSGLWSEFRRLIGEIRPRAVLLENVPNIVHIGGTAVIADLAALGYDAKWGIVSAQDAGAPHVRKRWWCVAMVNTAGARLEGSKWYQSPEPRLTSGSEKMEYAHSERRETGILTTIGGQTRHADRRYGTYGIKGNSLTSQPVMGRNVDGVSARMDGHRLMALEYPAAPNQAQHEWEPPRVAQKDKHTSARLKALGNAVVPQVVYPIAVELHETLRKSL